MKKSIEFYIFLGFTILSAVALVFIIKNGECTKPELEDTIEEAVLLSQDESCMACLKGVERISSVSDPISEKEVKVVKFRISSGSVLEVRYDENNKIIFSEVLSALSVGQAIVVFIVLVFLFFSFAVTIESGCGLIREYKKQKNGE